MDKTAGLLDVSSASALFKDMVGVKFEVYPKGRWYNAHPYVWGSDDVPVLDDERTDMLTRARFTV